jgi:hypothetical protein
VIPRWAVLAVSVLAVSVLCSLGIASSAVAQAPIVALVLEGEWPSELGAEVRADLRASLRERGVSVIDADEGPTGVLATIRIEAPDLDHPMARIEIDDRVNQKQMEREIRLGAEPPDTWSVVIASAADELLRAAWIELTMPDAPPPAMTPPPEMMSAARASVAPDGPHDGTFGVSLSGAIEGYTGGAVLSGGDLDLVIFLIDGVALEVGFVVRGLIPPESALGSLNALALGGSIGARVPLLGRSGLVRLDVLAQLRGMFLDLRPVAAPGALAEGAQDGLLVLRGGLRAALAMEGVVHVGFAFFVGAPLLGVRAVDSNGAPLAAIEGVELGGRIEVSLWP